ncbi:SDR family NAD(P)-dependent oxidoreductase [Synechococcus sp. A10-1-5-1]|uniref:SDR family NAD(P)-dependent oxidoreductase n=1 Tax=Synechococcus sp. A10-1-5-1 TaxID=2936507 RepID=UPI002000B1E0|nr:SDR family NAD(P)-dependent oxidoreductase [Synechococcus sp. A10-1-5-1]UPM50039.1 SDR family NAD(P)-dependent oxidoreductase [Synechococcus sp. A10-1-5-1]
MAQAEAIAHRCMGLTRFQGRTVAITGASGSLGRALLLQLDAAGAQLIALTSSDQPLRLERSNGDPVPLEQVRWSVGQEQALSGVLARVDILLINHGVNCHGERSPDAIERSLEVNALSSWRLLEVFAQQDDGKTPREIWINTSEAEIQAALSPIYEISKRLQGQLLSLRSLDLASETFRIRRLVLGPFRSALNPIGLMSADFVAREILRQAHWGVGLVIVTPNPLTYLLMPLATLSRWAYFRVVSSRS